MKDEYLAEDITWLIESVHSRFPGCLIRGIQVTRYESLKEVHVAFDIKDKEVPQ